MRLSDIENKDKSLQYENGLWSGRINHFSDRGKTLAQIRKESGRQYALGYKDGRKERLSKNKTYKQLKT